MRCGYNCQLSCVTIEEAPNQTTREGREQGGSDRGGPTNFFFKRMASTRLQEGCELHCSLFRIWENFALIVSAWFVYESAVHFLECVSCLFGLNFSSVAPSLVLQQQVGSGVDATMPIRAKRVGRRIRDLPLGGTLGECRALPPRNLGRSVDRNTLISYRLMAAARANNLPVHHAGTR